MERLKICVFCASSDHVPEVYREAAAGLGRELAARRMVLIYGGGNNGLMGILSEQVHRNGGTVIGVIPRSLENQGFAYQDADQMIVTDDLRQRKAVMERSADGFICLPGAFGTLEETLEIITLRQLGLLSKPVVIVNTNGYFNGLLAQLEHMCRERFCGPEYIRLFHVSESPAEALDFISANQERAGEEGR